MDIQEALACDMSPGTSQCTDSSNFMSFLQQTRETSNDDAVNEWRTNLERRGSKAAAVGSRLERQSHHDNAIRPLGNILSDWERMENEGGICFWKDESLELL